MRDPLAWIPIRYKLPLAFALLCVIALVLSGYVVTKAAREALSTQIRLRLEERAGTVETVVEKSLSLLVRRVEDFASDGFIRIQMARLVAEGDESAAPETAAALVRHLRVNKLTLVEEFVDAFLLDADGRPVMVVGETDAVPDQTFARNASWVGPIAPRSGVFAFPRFVLSAPVTGIDDGRLLGYLQIVVRADVWADGVAETLGPPSAAGFEVRLSSAGGGTIDLVANRHLRPGVEEARVQDEESLRFDSPVSGADWRLELAADPSILTIPIQAIVQKSLFLGLALVALTLGLVLFPHQFLLKPLATLQEAARRIAGGDFSARVDGRSQDEVGELAMAFNFMAGAIEERTVKLERNAAVLKKRKEQIRFERDRLQAVIRSMDDGLFMMDRDGRIDVSNEAARPVIAALGRDDSNATPLACRRHGSATRSCLHCMAESRDEIQGCLIGVGSRVYEVNGTSLRGPDQAIMGKVFVSRDVTVRVRESEQQAHQERLAVLGEIAAVMAHELNNPLAAISMFSQMLLAGLDTATEARTHAEVIHRNTESCKATIRRLLDMSTTSKWELDSFDVTQMVIDVVQLLEPVAQRAGVRIQLQEPAEARVGFGDELQLRQALVNLVMNSIQALEGEPDGLVTLAVDERGPSVAILVSDNGPGIDAAVRDRIFEPFFTTKPPGEGTGLGLPTSRRIVASQGGRLSLVETGAEGTVFEIRVPRHASATASTTPSLAAHSVEGPAPVVSGKAS